MIHPVARRYAQALYEEAARQERVEAIDEDVGLIRESLENSEELVRLFESPVIPREKKRAVVQALFEERVTPLTHRFLHLLIEKQREQLFAEVVKAYRALRDEQEGIVEIQARTARSLDEDGRAHLATQLEQMTGKKVRLHARQDADLIGGVVVRVGDTVYDGSVRRQLQRLHEQMKTGRAATNGHG